MAVLNLTEARIRDLPLGSGIHRDTQVKGLMVICHKTTRSYAVQGDVRRNGRHVRTVRVKIDRCDRIGLRDARNRAKALMSQIQSGIDPAEGPAETGITLERALSAHLDEKRLVVVLGEVDPGAEQGSLTPGGSSHVTPIGAGSSTCEVPGRSTSGR